MGTEIGRGIRGMRREVHVEEEEEAGREMGTGEHGKRTRSSGRGGRWGEVEVEGGRLRDGRGGREDGGDRLDGA